MNVGALRAADRWIGRPLCALLTGLRRILPERRGKAPGDVRRVLFVKLSEMGALVLSAPAFGEAARVFPQAEVWLLCFDENAEIAAEAAGIPRERLLVVRTGGVLRTVFGLLGAIRRARALRFDVILDLEYLTRVGASVTWLAGAPVRAGYHRFAAEGLYCGDLYTHRATWNAHLHVACSYVSLVRAAAEDAGTAPLPKSPAPRLAELRFPEFRPTDADDRACAQLLAGAGVPAGARIVLVNPNASDLLPLRRWPEERFAELCRTLRATRPDVWTVLTGAPHEAALAARIVAAAGGDRTASVVGKTDLRGLLTLFSRASVLVSADSGPPHFAALTPIRCVTLFGPETPALYGPVNDRNEAISAGLACSPCIHAWNRRVSTCRDNVCMQRIEVGRVAAAVVRALGE